MAVHILLYAIWRYEKSALGASLLGRPGLQTRFRTWHYGCGSYARAKSLPAGTEIMPVYDRSELIDAAIETLKSN
jgi:hypothetical protein